MEDPHSAARAPTGYDLVALIARLSSLPLALKHAYQFFESIHARYEVSSHSPPVY